MLKDTIISAFNYDGTLLKWLKKVEDALQNASASEFRVNKKGNATISFSIVFANGDTLESGDIILQQGESVTNATIRQGHLILTLSNGNELDAGDLGAVTGFSINDSQHLIVTYQNGTTQDLGAIFTGDVSINGALSTPILTSQNNYIEAQKPVIEVMNGYSFALEGKENLTLSVIYAGAVKNGNKLTLVAFFTITRTGEVVEDWASLGHFNIPTVVAEKIIPYTASKVATNKIWLNNSTSLFVETFKNSSTRLTYSTSGLNSTLTLNVTYTCRIEQTYLLSDSIVA